MKAVAEDWDWPFTTPRNPAERRGDGEYGEHCNLAWTNPRTDECNLPTCDWNYEIGHMREFKFWVSNVQNAGTDCDIEIREYDSGITGWWFRGGCRHTSRIHQDQMIKMHYKVEIDLLVGFYHIAPQIEVRSNCGDALLIDRAELDWTNYEEGNIRLGTWGGHNDIGWCVSEDSSDRYQFGHYNDARMCPKQICFDSNIVADDSVTCGHCIASPRPNQGCFGGALRGTTSE